MGFCRDKQFLLSCESINGNMPVGQEKGILFVLDVNLSFYLRAFL